MIDSIFHRAKQHSENEFISYIRIPAQEYRYMKQLMVMNGTEIYQKYGLKRDESITHTFHFQNGYSLDMKLVICEEERPYIDLILFDEKNREIACDIGDDYIGSFVMITHEMGQYLGIIQIQEEENENRKENCSKRSGNLYCR